jgi:hypothetical protein
MVEYLWGASPLRGLSEATASQRQLHEMIQFTLLIVIIFAARPCGMEAGGQAWYRTQVNPQAGWLGRASAPQCTKPNIRSGRGSSEGGDHAKRFNLTPGDLHRSATFGGSEHKGNDVLAMPVQKSDHPIVAMKPINVGRAKGVTS